MITIELKSASLNVTKTYFAAFNWLLVPSQIASVEDTVDDDKAVDSASLSEVPSHNLSLLAIVRSLLGEDEVLPCP